MAFLSSIPNILLIILGFGVLIFIHELGHFVAAKWANIRTEAFAVGMGPVLVSWRKGIGLRFGSTAKAVESRVRAHLKSRGTSDEADANGDESAQRRQLHRAMDQLGIGETEYSLRILPIGGFVKMLGQEDANPSNVSDDPRSYNMCAVGKRMIVVSAGVIMNLLLAIVLFVIAFTGGVQFQAPVVGAVVPTMNAALVRADNAAALGVSKNGIHSGDVVIQTDDDPAHTFADLQIASAMSNPDRDVRVVVKREGVVVPLTFMIRPEKDPNTGLLSFGIAPGASSTLFEAAADDAQFETVLREAGVFDAGVRPGMRLVSANGTAVSTYQQLSDAADQSQGKPIRTEWTALDDHDQPTGTRITADMPVKPTFQVLRYADNADDAIPEEGLLGLVPLVKIAYVPPDSPNRGILKDGDIVLRLGDVEAPRMREFFETIKKRPAGTIDMLVLRDGEETRVSARVKRKGLFNSAGMLNIQPDQAWECPIMASPMERIGVPRGSSDSGDASRVTAAASLRLLSRDRIASVSGMAISDWAELREALRTATAQAFAAKTDANVELVVRHLTPGHPLETLKWVIPAEDVAALHELGWQSPLFAGLFQPIFTTLTSGGNPIKAIAMGFHETKKTVLLTYLTIDRLIRGSVGISQLRGPVGIVHIGTKVADQGLLYILFFLGMISVNLAVINFLPMPIVDGGLFLFLIYEKFKGKPPPLAFQNAATIVGICMIGALFLITFYNDVVRLLS